MNYNNSCLFVKTFFIMLAALAMACAAPRAETVQERFPYNEDMTLNDDFNYEGNEINPHMWRYPELIKGTESGARREHYFELRPNTVNNGGKALFMRAGVGKNAVQEPSQPGVMRSDIFVNSVCNYENPVLGDSLYEFSVKVKRGNSSPNDAVNVIWFFTFSDSNGPLFGVGFRPVEYRETNAHPLYNGWGILGILDFSVPAPKNASDWYFTNSSTPNPIDGLAALEISAYFPANVWHEFKLILNADSGRFTLYMNGEPLPSFYALTSDYNTPLPHFDYFGAGNDFTVGFGVSNAKDINLEPQLDNQVTYTEAWFDDFKSSAGWDCYGQSMVPQFQDATPLYSLDEFSKDIMGAKVGIDSGNLSLTLAPPPTKVLGVDYSPSFTYNSIAASPYHFFQAVKTAATGFNGSTPIEPFPATISTALNFGGVSYENVFDDPMEAISLATLFDEDDDPELISLNFVDYTVRASYDYPLLEAAWDNSKTFPYEIRLTGTMGVGRLPVPNLALSPYGRGWLPTDMEQLIFPENNNQYLTHMSGRTGMNMYREEAVLGGRVQFKFNDYQANQAGTDVQPFSLHAVVDDDSSLVYVSNPNGTRIDVFRVDTITPEPTSDPALEIQYWNDDPNIPDRRNGIQRYSLKLLDGNPGQVAVRDDGLTIVPSIPENKLYRINGQSISKFSAGDPWFDFELSSYLLNPHGAAFGKDGWLFVSNLSSDPTDPAKRTGTITRIDINNIMSSHPRRTEWIEVFAGDIRNPRALAYDDVGNYLYVLHDGPDGRRRISYYDLTDYEFGDVPELHTAMTLNFQADTMSMSSDGAFYMADLKKGEIYCYLPKGGFFYTIEADREKEYFLAVLASRPDKHDYLLAFTENAPVDPYPPMDPPPDPPLPPPPPEAMMIYTTGYKYIPVVPGYHDEISLNEDDSFSRHHKHGSVTHFSPDGYMDFREDRNGNRFLYNYIPMDVEGYSKKALSNITVESTGQEWDFSYNGGRLSNIKDSAGRITHFQSGPYGRVEEVLGPVSYFYNGQVGTRKKTEFRYEADDIDPNLITSLRTDYSDELMKFQYEKDSRMCKYVELNNMESFDRDFNYQDYSLYEFVRVFDQELLEDLISQGTPENPVNPYIYVEEDFPTIFYDGVGVYDTDADGNPTRNHHHSNDSPGRYEYQLDRFGRLVSEKLPMSAGTNVITRNDQENTITVTGPAGTTRVEFNEEDNVTSRNFYPFQSDEDASRFSYVYDNPFHFVSEITDPFSRKTRFDYDASGNLDTITDALEKSRRFEYENEFGLMSQYSDRNNKDASYRYDRNGNMREKYHGPGNRRFSFMRDDAGNITSYRSPEVPDDGFRLNYNDRNALTSFSGSFFSYDYQGNLSHVSCGNSIYCPPHKNTSYDFSLTGNLLHIKRGSCERITFKYTPDFKLKSRVRVNNGEQEMVWDEYDDYKRPVKLKLFRRSGGPLWQEYQYDPQGKLTGYTDLSGLDYLFSYNEMNELTGVQAGTLPPTTITRSDGQERTVEVLLDPGNANPAPWKYYFDRIDRLVKVEDPEGNATEYEYDANGNVVNILDAAGTEWEFKYDDANRLKEAWVDGVKTYTPNFPPSPATYPPAKVPITQKTTYYYDENDNLIRMVQTGGYPSSISFNYDDFHRLRSFSRGNFERFSFTYGNGGLTNVSSWGCCGEGLSLTRDTDGHITRKSHKRLGSDNFSYDRLGNLTEIRKRGGARIWIQRDGDLNIPEEIKLFKALDQTLDQEYSISFEYIDPWIMTSARNELSESDFTLDDDHRVIGVREALTRAGVEANMGFDYQGSLNVMKQTFQVGSLSWDQTYTRDRMGRLTQMDFPGGSVSYTINEVGLPTVRTVTGETVDDQGDPITGELYTTGYAYDKMHRLVHIETTPGPILMYADSSSADFRIKEKHKEGYMNRYIGRNEAGHISTLFDLVYPDMQYDSHKYWKTDFKYDDDFRLIEVDYPEELKQVLPDEEYSYNAVGWREASKNSRKVSQSQITETVQYHYYYVSPESTAPSYLWGTRPQLHTDGLCDYEYDDAANLKKRKCGVNTAEFIYNGFNQLTEVTVRPGLSMGSFKTIKYEYDWVGRRISKEVNDILTLYVYDGLNLIAELDGDGNVLARYFHEPGKVDRPVAMERGGQFFFYHYDERGSVVYITNKLGHIVQKYYYDAYGRINMQHGNLQNPFTFMGREWDAEARVYHFRTRIYSPDVGRFMQMDPIMSYDPYQFVNNNPVNYSDPLGMRSITIPYQGVGVALSMLGAKQDIATLGETTLPPGSIPANAAERGYENPTLASPWKKHAPQNYHFLQDEVYAWSTRQERETALGIIGPKQRAGVVDNVRPVIGRLPEILLQEPLSNIPDEQTVTVIDGYASYCGVLLRHCDEDEVFDENSCTCRKKGRLSSVAACERYKGNGYLHSACVLRGNDFPEMFLQEKWNLGVRHWQESLMWPLSFGAEAGSVMNDSGTNRYGYLVGLGSVSSGMDIMQNASCSPVCGAPIYPVYQNSIPWMMEQLKVSF